MSTADWWQPMSANAPRGEGRAPVLAMRRISIDSIHGWIGARWTLESGQFELAVALPPNTEGEVTLPTASQAEVREGGRSLGQVPGIIGVRTENRKVAIQLGSGSYEFSAPYA
jgi:alpha-L-rhamnosidase